MNYSNILIFVSHYLPGFKSGGPVRTIANMVERLSDEFHFNIVTLDRDLGEHEPYKNIRVGEWNQVGSARVFYLRGNNPGLRAIHQIINSTDHDILYLNSFFDLTFSIYPLLLRRMGWLSKKPVLLAPRGEFSEGALGIKAAKKIAYINASKAAGLYKNVNWHASSAHEEQDIKRAIGPECSWIQTAIDMPPLLSGGAQSASRISDNRDDGSPLNVVFLSRISPMKNLVYAIDVLTKVHVPVIFDIYGPIGDEGYWMQSQELFKNLPKNIRVDYRGVVSHEMVPEILAKYDLFFLPTLGENYGHVIAEALAVGTPVLISDATPWRQLDTKGIGWDLPLESLGRFASVIEDFYRMSANERSEMSRAAQTYAREVLSSPDILESNRQLFKNLLRN